MRRIIVAVTLLLLSFGAWAQYADAGFIKRVGTHIEMDGERLSTQDQAALLADIGGHDFNAEWERARKGRNTGLGLVIGGGAATLAGFTVLLLGATTSLVGAAIGGSIGAIGGEEGAQQGAEEGAKAGNPLIISGLITSGAGLVTAGVGVPILVKNCDKLNSIVNTHNNGGIPTAQLNFGHTGNGIGLALKF